MSLSLLWLSLPWLTAWADETVYAVAEIRSERFPDADTPGPVIPAGSELLVLVREGDRLRVRVSLPAEDAGPTSAPKLEFGWVSSDEVTTEAPASPETQAPETP